MLAKPVRYKKKSCGEYAKRAVALPLSCEHPKRLWTQSESVYDQLDESQRAAVKFSIDVKTAALFFEQGTGKTWICGGVVEALADNDFEALIVVPLTNYETTWVKFFGEQLPHISVTNDLSKLSELPRPRVLLIHYEALPKVIKKARKRRWSLIAYDESQRLKARGTLQSRTAKKLRHSSEFKLILSGTPIEAQPVDLWAQFRFLNPDVFGDRWGDFESEYMEPMEDIGPWRPGLAYARKRRKQLIERHKRPFNTKRLPQLIEAIKPFSMRHEAIGLPPLEMIRTHVTLRGHQRRLYEEMERNAVATTLRLTAPLKVTQRVKLRQILGGFVFDDEGIPYEVGRAKLRRVKKLITELPSPVVIFCTFREEIEAIRREVSCEVITGANRKQRPDIVRRFQRGEIDTLVVQTRSGGVGLDLYAAADGIMYSPPESSIDFYQAIKRLHRRGQTKKVRMWLLVADDTVDEPTYEALEKKRRTSEEVLKHLKRRYHDGR